MRRPFAAFSIVPVLFLTQIPFFSKSSKPEIGQQLVMYSKPAVVRIVSGCGGEFRDLRTRKEYRYVFDPNNQKLEGYTTGTGYFINSDGYIVTNAHMVENTADSKQKCEDILERNLKKDFVEKKLAVTEQEVADLLANGKIELIEDSFFNYKYVILPNANAKGEAEALPFEIKKRGTSTNEGSKDVAIIKVAVTDAPILRLAKTGDLQAQDPIIVIGYPGEADADFLSQKSGVEATITQGIISNPNKTLQDGSPIIQVDVLVAPGSSGSPILNRQGEAIGMIALRKDEKSRIPFAIPTATIMEFVRDAGVDNTEGKADPLYREGLNLFWQGDFAGAKTKFDAVLSLFSQHSEANRLIHKSEEMLAQNWKDRSYIPLLAGIGVAAIGLLGAYFIVRRRSALAGVDFDQDSRFVDRASDEFKRGERRYAQPESSRMITAMSQKRGQSTMIAVDQAFLELENAQGLKTRFSLKADRHQLGRDRSWADLNLPDSGWSVLSKRHAILQREGNDYRIYDGDRKQESTNGVWLNGDRILPEGYLLRDGDQFQIGQDRDSQVTVTYLRPDRRYSPSKVDRNSHASDPD
jgi:S1-C subfamily serine protease